jgi:hypothetical protein
MPRSRSFRAACAAALLLASAAAADAQTYSAPRPHRQFVTISYDWLYTQPLHFANYPVEDLVGRAVAEAQFERFDYRTRDGAITIDVTEFRRHGHGAGITLYPFGNVSGTTLALRGSIEDLPTIHITFDGDGAPPPYDLIGARAYDLGAAVYVSDRSTGFGLGGHAFAGGGVGRIRQGNRDGDRYFFEGGGGVTSGPFGLELSVKFAWNRFEEPVRHRMITVPIALRGTVSF